MADELEGARTLPVKFRDQGDGSTAEGVAALGYLWDGAAWTKVTGDAANGLDVDVTRSALPSGAARQVDVEAVRDRFAAAAALADGAALPTTTRIGTVPMLYNGTDLDVQRGVESGTVFASLPRTATATSGSMTNRGHRGVALFLNITVAGTGNLQLRVVANDPVTGGGVWLADTDGFTNTGLFSLELYPGASGAIPSTSVAPGWLNTRVAGSLAGRSWRVQVVHSDASSWTYSVGYVLLP